LYASHRIDRLCRVQRSLRGRGKLAASWPSKARCRNVPNALTGCVAGRIARSPRPVPAGTTLRCGGSECYANATLEIEAELEKVTADELATYGLVLEENLRDITTWSVGEVAIRDQRVTYYGKQRTVRDNSGRLVYGGSHLVCMRGGWAALDAIPMSRSLRAAVVAANDTIKRLPSSPVSSPPGATTT
jgi:hypothetical protein